MGIGKAAVYKHIPHYFPERVGAVGGLVGVIGGLGGFVMPILFGALAQATRLPTTTFMFLFALSLVSLVWMIVVIHQITRQSAPRVADDLEAGGRLAVAGAEMAAGGELLFAEHLRRWQEARRAAVAAGGE
jgi:NNP family nitrate/nitrite transporter-like MFS transporter